jgi:hypothetical protein
MRDSLTTLLVFLNEKVLCNLELGPCVLMFIFGRKGTKRTSLYCVAFLPFFPNKKVVVKGDFFFFSKRTIDTKGHF